MNEFDAFCNLILETYGKKIVSAQGSDGSGQTQVTYDDGSTGTLTGTRATRNNNPSNIEYGQFAISNGAVGTDGRYAVFPDVETGTKAQINLLKTSTYQNLSLKDAITRYAPPQEGNNASYPDKLSKMTGIPLDTKLSSLTPNQFLNMVDKMQTIEGFKQGDNVNFDQSQQYAKKDSQDNSNQNQQTNQENPYESGTKSFIQGIYNTTQNGKITPQIAQKAFDAAKDISKSFLSNYGSKYV